MLHVILLRSSSIVCAACCWFQLRQKIVDMAADSLQVRDRHGSWQLAGTWQTDSSECEDAAATATASVIIISSTDIIVDWVTSVVAAKTVLWNQL